MQNTKVMVGWKHEMIISGLQKKDGAARMSDNR